MITDKLPPYSEIAEKTVLSACLVSKNEYYEAIQALKPEHFYIKKHQLIFETLIKAETNDIVTITDRCKEVPDIESELACLFEDYNASSIKESICIIQDKYGRRQAIEAAYEAITEAHNNTDLKLSEITNKLHQKLYKAVEFKENNQPKSIGELMPEIIEYTAAVGKGEIIGIQTGLIDLDQAICGLTPGDYVVLAGRPSMGKSSLADTIVRHNTIKQKIPTAVFSVEMTKILWGTRSLFSEAGISLHALRSGMLPKRDHPKISLAAFPLSEAPLYIDDTPNITLTEIINKANYVKSQIGLGLILIDYLQLMGSIGKTESRQQAISEISRGLKSIAKMFQVPVIALSQLSRAVENRNPPIPQMSDLRESGAIEQDADVVLLLYREEYYKKDSDKKGICEIIIGKQRNGPVGVIETRFDASAMRFLNLVKDDLKGFHDE